jgi:hypothetical protein
LPHGLRFVQPVDQVTFVIRLAHVDVEAELLRVVFQHAGNVVQRP